MGKRYRLKSGKCSLLVGSERLLLSPGDEVVLGEFDIMPDGFKDQFKRIMPKGQKEADSESPDAGLSDNFVIVHRGGGKYNVVNKATGKEINDVLLSKSDAESLVNYQTASDGKGIIEKDEMERTEDMAE